MSKVDRSTSARDFLPATRSLTELRRAATGCAEVGACLPWLEAEIELVRPRVLVCLGATAAHALIGRSFSVLRERGRVVSSPLAPDVTATVHPSSVLRAPDEEARQRALELFIADFEPIRRLLDAG